MEATILCGNSWMCGVVSAPASRCTCAAPPRCGSPSRPVRPAAAGNFRSTAVADNSPTITSSRDSALSSWPLAGDPVFCGVRAPTSAARALAMFANTSVSCCGESLHRIHQVRDQVRPPLQRHIHLRPLRVDGLPLVDQVVPHAHELAARSEQDNHHDEQDDKADFHVVLLFFQPVHGVDYGGDGQQIRTEKRDRLHIPRLHPIFPDVQ